MGSPETDSIIKTGKNEIMLPAPENQVDLIYDTVSLVLAKTNQSINLLSVHQLSSDLMIIILDISSLC